MALGLLAFLAWSSIGSPEAAYAGSKSGPEAIVALETLPRAGAGLRASVDGHEAVFLFDTGEGISTVTPAFAREIGCNPWGQTTGFRMTGERLDLQRCDNLRVTLAGKPFGAPIAGVFDITKLLPESRTVLAGSLGLDIFSGRKITIQPRLKRIVVESPASFAERVRAGREIPARLVRDAEGVALAVDAGVPTKAGMAWMELDTGNGGTLVIGKHIAGLLGLDPASASPQEAHFAIVDGVPVDGPARVRDLIMDGDIGNHVLKNWDITFDLSAGRVWLAPAAT